MTISIGRFLVLFALFLTAAVQAQSYPAKLVRLVVAYPAGGSTDIVARLVGQKLGEALSADGANGACAEYWLEHFSQGCRTT